MEILVPLPQMSIEQEIVVLRRRFPGSLVCTTCARLIASTPAGYAKSNFTPEQVATYRCAECRYDADPKRSVEVTARFAVSKAAAAAARLQAPLAGLSPCSCTERVTCASCLQQRAAEAAEGRRAAHPYFDTCLVNGHHADLDALADCPHPSAAVAEPRPEPAFCAHGRPAESCVVHDPRRAQSPMPKTLARCGHCLGYHGKTGQDRCPYNRQEAAIVRAARTPETGYLPKSAPVASTGVQGVNKIDDFPGSISHLRDASKRLRRKGGRPATGTSRWARRRRGSPA